MEYIPGPILYFDSYYKFCFNFTDKEGNKYYNKEIQSDYIYRFSVSYKNETVIKDGAIYLGGYKIVSINE